MVCGGLILADYTERTVEDVACDYGPETTFSDNDSLCGKYFQRPTDGGK
jgi:hypothetical protein